MYSKALSILTLVLVSLCSSSWGGKGQSLYDFKVKTIEGTEVAMESYKNKVLLIVNVASQCGHTDAHYKALKRLHEILSFGENFEILAFPCNDFGEQEPWEHPEIKEFVRNHHKAEFPLFEKVQILQKEGRNELWDYIIDASGSTPGWNFNKYLFDASGKFVKSWDGDTSVESIFDEVETVVRAADAKNPKQADKEEL